MKILIFTEIFDCGGIDTFIINLINNWPRSGDSFVIIANSNYPGLKIIEDKLIRPCEIIRHSVPIYSNFPSSTFITKAIKKTFYPILGYFSICFNVLAFRNLLTRTNAQVMMVINGGYPGADSCRAAAISWRLFAGKGKSIHNFHNISQKAPWYLFIQENIIDWILCKCVSQFVTVSKAAADSISVRNIIFRKNITRYIYNGINVPSSVINFEGNIRDELGISETTPLCLLLATYEPRKGHYFLFTAFKKVIAKVPNAHLLVCGYGLPEEINLVSKYIRDMELGDHIHLMGFKSDISNLFNNADVLLVSSQSYESFGFTSVEAMARKVPVVATDVGGIPEVVINGEGGYCVSRNDSTVYADNIIKLLENEDLRKEQGLRGYKRFKELFTAETMALKYAEIIQYAYALNKKDKI